MDRWRKESWTNTGARDEKLRDLIKEAGSFRGNNCRGNEDSTGPSPLVIIIFFFPFFFFSNFAHTLGQIYSRLFDRRFSGIGCQEVFDWEKLKKRKLVESCRSYETINFAYPIGDVLTRKQPRVYKSIGRRFSRWFLLISMKRTFSSSARFVNFRFFEFYIEFLYRITRIY